MLVSSVKNLSYISNYRAPKRNNHISFKGDNDAFVSTPEIIKGDINRDETSAIINSIKEENLIASGYTSKV